MGKNLNEFLQPSQYIDSDNPIVVKKAAELTKGLSSDVEKAKAIFLYVRDEIVFDIVVGFRNILAGKNSASVTITEGRGFCAQKAATFAGLCRACGIPARICFQIVECKDKPFYPENIRKVYGDRPQPWHAGSECYLNGKWVVADCTVDAASGTKVGRPVWDFDGVNDTYTTEGPVLTHRGSAVDIPQPVFERYCNTARNFINAVDGKSDLAPTPQKVLDGNTEGLVLIPRGE